MAVRPNIMDTRQPGLSGWRVSTFAPALRSAKRYSVLYTRPAAKAASTGPGLAKPALYTLAASKLAFRWGGLPTPLDP